MGSKDEVAMFDVEYEIDSWIKKAIDWHASDIHIEPEKDSVHIRFRVDGRRESVAKVGKVQQEKVINRIKLLSHIDIGERRIPQDGRWTYAYLDHSYTLRVSTMPTVWGEHIVLRISDPTHRFQGLEALGMPQVVREKLEIVLGKPYGLFLVTGPTGSGKSSTLYTLLSLLNDGSRHIICLEDPVEQELEGVTQVEMNEKSGLTFVKGLRAALRQDPDVMMVGEIRDRETAQLAIQAALTGHQVFSTLHTNTAKVVLERLIDMGVEPFLVKAAVLGAMAQRLVRTPCGHCHGEGPCAYCRSTGYKGRMGIYEVLLFPEETVNWDHIDQYVYPTLEISAKEAVETGKTTWEEVKRIGLAGNEMAAINEKSLSAKGDGYSH